MRDKLLQMEDKLQATNDQLDNANQRVEERPTMRRVQQPVIRLIQLYVCKSLTEEGDTVRKQE